jgi:hypothetical protein
MPSDGRCNDLYILFIFALFYCPIIYRRAAIVGLDVPISDSFLQHPFAMLVKKKRTDRVRATEILKQFGVTQQEISDSATQTVKQRHNDLPK